MNIRQNGNQHLYERWAVHWTLKTGVVPKVQCGCRKWNIPQTAKWPGVKSLNIIYSKLIPLVLSDCSHLLLLLLLLSLYFYTGSGDFHYQYVQVWNLVHAGNYDNILQYAVKTSFYPSLGDSFYPSLGFLDSDCCSPLLWLDPWFLLLLHEASYFGIYKVFMTCLHVLSTEWSLCIIIKRPDSREYCFGSEFRAETQNNLSINFIRLSGDLPDDPFS